MSKTINVPLTEEECLILSNFLSERIDFAERNGKTKFDFSNPDFAEKIALNNLNSALEPLVNVVFNDNYPELLEAAKKELTAGHTPEAFGE